MKTIIACFMLWIFSLSHTAFATCRKVTLIVMRHGHGEHMLLNIRNSHLMSQPMHLTHRGIYEAKLAALKLSQIGITQEILTNIFASPLPRTKETAAVLFNSLSSQVSLQPQTDESLKNLEKFLDDSKKNHLIDLTSKLTTGSNPVIKTDSQLIERDFGACEGQSFNLACAVNPHSPLAGESAISVEKRALAFLHAIEKSYCSVPDQDKKTILVITHDIVAKKLIKLITNKAEDLKSGEFRILPLTNHEHFLMKSLDSQMVPVYY